MTRFEEYVMKNGETVKNSKGAWVYKEPKELKWKILKRLDNLRSTVETLKSQIENGDERALIDSQDKKTINLYDQILDARVVYLYREVMLLVKALSVQHEKIDSENTGVNG